jgi:hypothetical protein
MERIQELRKMVLEEARSQLKANQSLLRMLEKSTPLEDLARLREVWVEPLEQLVQDLEDKQKAENDIPL